MTVHVVGNVTEDLVFSLPRLPRAGETIIASERFVDIGGKGLNQAALLARAGCDARLVAAIGADPAAERVRALVSRDLQGSHLLRVEGPSDQSVITVAADGENHIVSSAAAADALDGAAAVAAMGPISAGDTVLVQGNLGQNATRDVLAAGRAAGAWTIANPSPIRWAWDTLLPLCDLVVVNRAELAELSGADAPTPETLISKGAGGVLWTLGSEGAKHLDAHGETIVPAAPVDVVDSAGAGDTFLAVFVAARLSGLDVSSALVAAAQAAAITVSRRGTSSAFPTAAEITHCLGPEAFAR